MKLLLALATSVFFLFGAGTAMAGIEFDDIEDDVVIVDDAFDDVAGVVPEPTAALALGAGLVAVAAARRLRKR